MKRISIIVPTFKRPEYLNRTLASLTNQNTDVDYEVLVVDDEESDSRSKHIARFWAKRGPVKYLTPGPDPRFHGRTRIRNFGLRRCEAEILIFLDDDMLVPPDFVAEHSRSHEGAAENQVVIGYRNHLKVSPNFLEHISPLNLASETVRFLELPSVKDERENIYQLCQGDLNLLTAPWTILYSNNFSLRRALLHKIGGGFNESFQGAWGGEDVELGYRLFKAGASFVLNRKAVGYHQWHYANWRRNMQSLHTNLLRFFTLYPTIETELYIHYPETGLPSYLKDLRLCKNLKASSSSAACDRPEVCDALRAKCASGSKVLLIGAGNARKLRRESGIQVFTDPRASVIRQLKREGGKTVLELVGCHLPYDDNAFDTVLVTDFSVSLSSYHRAMIIQEAYRLARNQVHVAVDPTDMTNVLFRSGSQPTVNEMIASFQKWSGAPQLTADISAELVQGTLIVTLRHSNIQIREQARTISRLALVIPSDSQDTHTEQAVELALALAKQGCDIAIQLEDHRRQQLVYSEGIAGMNRFNRDEQRLLRIALLKDLRGRNHLYPRLSLTGNYHYHGKRIDWILENKIGLLSSPYVQVLNDESDSLWIPSGRVAQLFQQSGVHLSKIKEIPVALPDHMVNGFNPNREGKHMRFVALGTIEKADGLDLAIEAFCLAAKNLPHSELIVRIFPIESREVVANDMRQNLAVRLSHKRHLEDIVAIQQYRIRKWKRLVRFHGLAGRVTFENVDYRFRGWPAYIEDAGCLIQPQRVDVLGQWVLRAMALRIPVISSGRYLPDSLKGRWMNYFVQNREISAADREWASNVIYTRWVEPQADSLIKHLTYIHRNRREAWRRADLAQQYVKKRLIWSQVVQQYVDDLGRVSQEIVNDKRISGTASRSLFDELKTHNLINLEEEPFERR